MVLRVDAIVCPLAGIKRAIIQLLYMKSCLEEYKECDVGDIAEKYIEGQPQVSAVPVLPDEGGTVISGMDTDLSGFA